MKTYADSTLRGVKKDDLIAIIRCLEHNISVEEERNQNQFNLLMQEDIRKERYKWHDLRKDPSDLPEVGKPFVYAFKSKVLTVNRLLYNAAMGRGYEVKCMENQDTVDIEYIAWKYFEHFEDELNI